MEAEESFWLLAKEVLSHGKIEPLLLVYTRELYVLSLKRAAIYNIIRSLPLYHKSAPVYIIHTHILYRSHTQKKREKRRGLLLEIIICAAVFLRPRQL